MRTEPDDNQLENVINLYKKNDLTKALKYCFDIEKKFPHSTKIKNLLAELLYLQGNYEEAVIKFENLIILNETSDTNFFKLGLTYEKLNNPNKAFDNYEKAFSLAPEKDIYLVTIFNFLRLATKVA